MKDWTFTDAVKLAYPCRWPSKIIIAATSLYEAKAKLRHYIEIGVRLGFYENRH